MGEGLLERSYAALLAGARNASRSVRYDQKGYAPRWEDNLMSGLPLAEISHDLSAGAGQELEGKLRAAHSSAALAVNTFGPWRTDSALPILGGITAFRSVRFEAPCPTGLCGTPPHLDLLAEGDLPVAVESKCTEWMTTKPAAFSLSYDRLRPCHGCSPWLKQVHRLRAAPDRYRFLDAAQIVKHALGLLRRYGTREVRLVYLYWEPRNGGSWPECRQHRDEAEDLAARVERSTVRLIPLGYHELWAEWESQAPPGHLAYLRARYDREA
jgi:Restriction Endonuclease associating with ARP